MAQNESQVNIDNRFAEIRAALRIKGHVSRRHCRDCGDEIPDSRRESIPGKPVHVLSGMARIRRQKQ
ncbi:TraR/DksA C4-type zinc finger protein [Salmonella sp. WGH-01]|nr:TraR/DksA C4-type zinc finger protein [Salmonella sp. WGH-01]